MGVEPTNDHQGLSLAALPVCVPCQESNLQEPNSKNQYEYGIWFLKFGSSGPLRSVPDGIRTHDLHRDKVASTPDCSTRTNISVAQVGVEPTASLGLSKGGLPIAYRARPFQFRRLESNQHPRVQSPMSYQLDDPGVAVLLTLHRSTRFGEKESNLHRLVQSRAAYH